VPDIFKNARLTLSAMHPRKSVDGFTNEVRLYELDPESAAQVRDVLNAGANHRSGARDGHARPLSSCAPSCTPSFPMSSSGSSREARGTERGLGLDRLEKRIREALMPYVLDTADSVLQHLHPIDETRGFTSEIFLNEVDPQHLRPVRNLLTAGSSLRVVVRDKSDAARYYVHADLYTTLARIRARELAMASQGRRPIEGGRSGKLPSPMPAASACSATAANPRGPAARRTTSCGRTSSSA
jgi:hypothetical protein